MRRNLSTGGFQYHNSSSRLLIPRGKERERERERREKTTKTSLRNAAHQSFAENVISSSRLISLCCCSPLHSEEEDDKTTERERENFFFPQTNRRREMIVQPISRVKGTRKAQRDNFFFFFALFGILLDNDFCLFGTPFPTSPHFSS